MSNKIPMMILSGFLGAGKTTLLRNLLQQAHHQDVSVSVIVNDMSALDVDGVVIANTELVSHEAHNFVTVAGCSISSEAGIAKLAAALDQLIQERTPDLILLETSGASHPLPLVKFLQQHAQVELTNLLAVVDAVMLAQDYANGQQLIPALQAQLQQGTRSIDSLLAEQIMFATQLLLTKYERIEPEQLQLIAKSIHPLNPYIAINAISWGNLALERVLNVPRYPFERVNTLMNELREQVQQSELSSETRQLSHQVIEDERPFHPQRLWDTCQQFLGRGIYRSKGFFWLPSRDDMALLWNQAAGSINLELVSYWKIAVLQQGSLELSNIEITQLQQQLAKVAGRFGDRRCQLTVIGEPAATVAFTDALRQCFLTERELTQWQAGDSFQDPWPKRFAKLKQP